MDVMRDLCIFAAGTIAIAILAREAHVWWTERHVRRSRKQYYQNMKDEALRYVEELYREVGRR